MPMTKKYGASLEMHFHLRIYAHTPAHNYASVKVLAKAGYQLEGRLRKARTKEGCTYDALPYAIVR